MISSLENNLHKLKYNNINTKELSVIFSVFICLIENKSNLFRCNMPEIV